MTRRLAVTTIALVALASAYSAAARAQQLSPGQSPGARAGNAYVPSTHTPGCGGVLCDADDPVRAAGAPPPPPCEGLLCSLSPYAMAPPVTAAEARRIQEERARAAMAAPTPAPIKPTKHARRHTATAKVRKAVAARTPAPAAAPAGAEK